MNILSRFKDAGDGRRTRATNSGSDTQTAKTRRIDGFDVTETSRICDEEVQVELSVVDNEAAWVHTACRIIETEGAAPTLWTGFAIAGFNAAIPDDVAPQETANAMVERLLAERPDHGADLVAAFRVQWANTRGYLDTRWAEIAKTGPQPDRLSVVHTSYSISIGLGSLMTRLGHDEVCAVQKQKAGGYRKLYSHDGKISENVSAPTQELLARLPQFSGHEKLRLLSGQKSEEYETAWAAFDEYRKIRGRMIPLRCDDAIATQHVPIHSGLDFSFANGDTASLYGHAISRPGSEFHARLFLAKEKCDIDVLINSEKGTIGRARVHEKRFKSPALLDEAMRRFLRMVLILDRPTPAEALPADSPAFDPEHPLAQGFSVPLRHQPLFGAILGAPYETARKASERFAASKAKRAAKAEDATDLPKTLPDGAILGRLDKRKPVAGALYISSSTRLGQVMTGSASDTRPKRRIEPIYGFSNARPLTAKQIARLPLLTKPDALQLVHDRFLRGEERDLIEAAFRLSFELPPGARNPVFDAVPQISSLSVQAGSPDLRITRVHDKNRIDLAVFAMAYRNGRHAETSEYATGAAFLALRIGDTQDFYVRPAIMTADVSLPLMHRDAIENGITQTFAHRPEQEAALKEGFKNAWAVLSKKYPES